MALHLANRISPALGLSAAPSSLRWVLPGRALRMRCRAERRTKFGSDAYEPRDLVVQTCPVPKEQQPMIELQQLQEAFLFDWPRLSLPDFATRLVGVFAVFFVMLGLPVSLVTFSAQDELLQVIAASSIGSGFITLLLVLRLYLGYSHVSSRLLSATVEYEETGWYDGQVWVKTPQMLMRDRLLSTYQVKPILDNLKRTLLSLSGGMVAATVLLLMGPTPKAYSSDLSGYTAGLGFPDSARALAVQAAERRGFEARMAELERVGIVVDKLPQLQAENEMAQSR